jgi:ubiquinone/menaquinone biosynthesis C-methylase UbiE
MLDNVEKNLEQWDRKHPWSKDGDEWNGQAKLCGVPYETWKASLVDALITPFLHPDANVLEIAPGHGRWTEYLVAGARHVTVVDISANCLDFCRNRFQQSANIDYFLTTGHQLPHYLDNSIDFAWSFDSFVHMDRNVIGGYLREMKRVLKIGGRVTLHHADVEDIANHVQGQHQGWRSQMNGKLLRQLAEEAGLEVVAQFTYWDEAAKLGVPRFGDKITQLLRRT